MVPCRPSRAGLVATSWVRVTEGDDQNGGAESGDETHGRLEVGMREPEHRWQRATEQCRQESEHTTAQQRGGSVMVRES